jgi:hypothetical protein
VTLHDADDRPGFFRQTRVLIPRAHKNVYRNYPVLLGLVAQGTVLGLIMGFTFWRLPEVRLAQTCNQYIADNQDPTGIQSLKNLSFQLVPSVFYLQQVFCEPLCYLV